MKKILLSLSFVAAVMAANAQTSIPVGVGAYEDMATIGNSTDNPKGEYSYPITVGTTAYTAGIFWWQDAVNLSDYSVARTGGEKVVTVTKGTAYSPIGFGFGDTNGDGTGTPFSINISNAKTLSFKAKASTGAPTLYIQVTDANGINGEVKASTAGLAGDGAKYGSAGLTSAYQTFTFDLTGMEGQTDPNVSMWPCLTYPTDCPDYSKASNVDFTKITKVSFFISGGTAYTGTVSIDDVKIGTTGYLGLGTQSASANVSSAVIYPNPASSSEAVSARLSLVSPSNVQVIVTDIVGKQVASTNFGTVSSLDEVVFNTSTLAKGSYLVTYVLDGAPAKSQIVVVR